jgi:hypothetical protein
MRLDADARLASRCRERAAELIYIDSSVSSIVGPDAIIAHRAPTCRRQVTVELIVGRLPKPTL